MEDTVCYASMRMLHRSVAIVTIVLSTLTELHLDDVTLMSL